MRLLATAIAPLAEAKSNWDVMRLLAHAMGYDEPWLHESAEDAIRGRAPLRPSRPANLRLYGEEQAEIEARELPVAPRRRGWKDWLPLARAG